MLVDELTLNTARLAVFPVSSFYAKLQAVASQIAFPIYLRPDQKSYSVSCL